MVSITRTEEGISIFIIIEIILKVVFRLKNTVTYIV